MMSQTHTFILICMKSWTLLTLLYFMIQFIKCKDKVNCYSDYELKTILIGSAIYNFVLSLIWKRYRPNIKPFNVARIPRTLIMFACLYIWMGMRGPAGLHSTASWISLVMLSMFKTILQLLYHCKLDNFGWLLLNNAVQSIIFGLIVRIHINPK
eukprot:538548_1